MDNIHKNHRYRLRKKFFESEKALEDHELLEMFLFSAYPQRNTNPIAHNLIKKCGGIGKVFEAEDDVLTSVKYVGDKVKDAIKIQGELLKQYRVLDKNKPKGIQLTPKNTGPYLINFFEGYSGEVIMLFTLNAECRVTRKIMLSRNGSKHELYDVGNIVKHALENHASYVIIAINEESGDLTVSQKEMDFLIELEYALTYINVRLADYVLVKGDEFLSFAKQLKLY